MTCIVAVEQDGIVYMAGDRGMNSGSQIVPGESKIVEFDNGEDTFTIGYAGDPGIIQVLRYEWDYPYISEGFDIPRLLVPSLKDVLAGYEYEAVLLIAYDSSIYEVGIPGYWCTQYKEIAIGSGSEFALGSLYSTKGAPITRVKTAAEAACAYSTGCSLPVDLAVIGAD